LTNIGDESEGWWRGTNVMGITGVFPNNFVEEFFETVEEKPKPGCPPLRFLSFSFF